MKKSLIGGTIGAVAAGAMYIVGQFFVPEVHTGSFILGLAVMGASAVCSSLFRELYEELRSAPIEDEPVRVKPLN